MKDESAVVELRQITKTYRQGLMEITALREIDLTIGRGEFAAFCGPSGSGKTTALNLIGALDRPTSGDLWLEGRLLNRLNRQQLSLLRRDRIGFVFQSFNLIPVLTAYENAESVLALQGSPAEERRCRVLDLFDQVGLAGLENRRPNELSGGQQQRVAIVRAIAAKPAVVLADEPTANVDSQTADNLLNVMDELNQDQGVTFIFSTHDPRVMARARRLIQLVDGQIASDSGQSSRSVSK
jgi:putative ABC transport system ATP-binding protein